MRSKGMGFAIAAGLAYLIYTLVRGAKIIAGFTLSAYGTPPTGRVLASAGWRVSVECQWQATTIYQAEFIFQGAQMTYIRYSSPLSRQKGEKATLMADFTPVALELPVSLVPGIYDMTINILDTSRPTETLDSLKKAEAIMVV